MDFCCVTGKLCLPCGSPIRPDDGRTHEMDLILTTPSLEEYTKINSQPRKTLTKSERVWA